MPSGDGPAEGHRRLGRGGRVTFPLRQDLGSALRCRASSARHNASMSCVHTPCATGDSIGIGEHSESAWASSALVGAATIVLAFISVPQKLKARGCPNALVSDASGKGNARRWTLEGRSRDGASVMPMLKRSNTANGTAASSRGELLHADLCISVRVFTGPDPATFTCSNCPHEFPKTLFI
jgi:hypothetical protein